MPSDSRDLARWVLVGALLFIVWWGQGHGTAAKAEEGFDAKKAVCALRGDIQVRHDNTQDYLNDHPKGLVSKSTGEVVIPAALLRKQLDDQEGTLATIDKSGVNCK